MSESSVKVAVLCGASGTGKTATLWEAGHMLRTQGIHHALIDSDELDRVWPPPETIEALTAISCDNLRAVWKTFSHLGVRHLVLCGVMASLPRSRGWIARAIPSATITFVRLYAERSTRERRLRDREVGSGFEREMQASDEASTYIDGHDPVGTHVVVTDGRGVSAVAAEVLRIVDWLP